MVGCRLILIAALALPCAGAKAPEIRAKIVYIDVKNAFFVIDKGLMDGAGADTAFTIVRESDLAVKFLGTADFEKFLGQNSWSKLILQTGDLGELRLGDIVYYSGP